MHVINPQLDAYIQNHYRYLIPFYNKLLEWPPVLRQQHLTILRTFWQQKVFIFLVIQFMLLYTYDDMLDHTVFYLFCLEFILLFVQCNFCIMILMRYCMLLSTLFYTLVSGFFKKLFLCFKWSCPFVVFRCAL